MENGMSAAMASAEASDLSTNSESCGKKLASNADITLLGWMWQLRLLSRPLYPRLNSSGKILDVRITTFLSSIRGAHRHQ